MASVTLGRKRDVETLIPVTAGLTFKYFSTDLAAIAGVSAADVTALGHLAPGAAPAGTLVIAGCNAPLPATFKKRLSTATATATTQATVTAYGDATTKAAIAAAGAAGWSLIKPIRLAYMGGGDKKTSVIVELSNGLYEIVNVFSADATSGNATLLGWELTPGSTIKSKMFRASSKMRCGRVKQKVTVGGKTGTKILPCKWSKLEDATVLAAGWKPASGERISDV